LQRGYPFAEHLNCLEMIESMLIDYAKNIMDSFKVLKDYFVNKERDKIINGTLLIVFILLLLDFFNIPSVIAQKIGSLEMFVLGVIIFFTMLMKVNVKSWIKSSIFGIIDIWLMECTIAFFAWWMIYIILHMVCGMQWQCHAILSLIIGIVLITVLVIRGNNIISEDTEIKDEIITLKKLYEGNISDSCGKVLLEDEPVDYDLLNRSEIIETMCDAIKSHTPKNNITVGLNGKWGSGKTTIIANVKKKLKDDETIDIIDFNAWSYENPIAVINNLLDTILPHIDGGYDEIQITRMKNKIIHAIFSVNSHIKELEDIFINSNEPSLADIKNKLNEYLAVTNKKIVVVIDNIERMDSKNSVLLLKTVADILSLNNITYILLYDKERLENALEKENIDKAYLKKIVQVEYEVPSIDEDTINLIINKASTNLLKKNNWEDEKLEDVRQALSLISDNLRDLRDVTRFINTVVNRMINNDAAFFKQLCLFDWLLLDTIRLNDLELYEIIHNYPSDFVSSDRSKKLGYEFAGLEKVKNRKKEEREELFRSIFLEHKESIKLLAAMFPNFYDYAKAIDSSVLILNKINQYRNNVLDGRINNVRYFDLYFTIQSNNFSIINDQVKQFAVNIQNNNIMEDMIKEIASFWNEENQREFFEILQLKSDGFSDEWNIIIPILYKYVNKLFDYSGFMVLSPRIRVEYLIAVGLSKIDDEHFEEFIRIIKKDYAKMIILWNIRKRFNQEDYNKYGIEDIVEKRRGALDEALGILTNEVIKKNVDIYSDDYYERTNIIGLYLIYREILNKGTGIRERIEYLINKDSICRFIWDCMSYSLGAQYNYYINLTMIDKLSDKETVEKLLKARDNFTDHEKIVIDIWNKTNEQYPEGFRENQVVENRVYVTNHELDLKI